MRSATFAILLTLQAACAGAASASDDRLLWHMVQATGDVSATNGAVLAVALDPKAPLPDGAVISTGANGRALLKRGGEQVALGPSSRVTLGSGELFTRIRQDAGSVLFSVGKRTAPHFEVDAPFLAAIVKGTVFTVTVDKTGSSVAVTQGAVEVATDGRSAVTLVKPGTTARVLRNSTAQIELVSGGHVSRTVTGYDDSWDAAQTAQNLHALPSGGAPELRQSDAVFDLALRPATGVSTVAKPSRTANGASAHIEQGTSAPPVAQIGTTSDGGSPSTQRSQTAEWQTAPNVDAAPLLRAQTYDTAAVRGTGALLTGIDYNLAQDGTSALYIDTHTVSDATALASRNAHELWSRAQRTANAKIKNTRGELPLREILLGLGALVFYMVANHMLGLRRRLKDARLK